MSDEPKLLPCPFCGGKAKMHKHFKFDQWSLEHQCSAVGSIHLEWADKARQIARWNTRSAP